MSVLDYRSGTSDIIDPGRARAGLWLGLAIYLGISWTWCIGMFLPVLLVRDYGFWAWVIFAIPNVIGAAAMGWVLKDGTSEAIAKHHRVAIHAFSAVTATFQIFFAGWMLRRVENLWWFAGVIALAAWMSYTIQGTSNRARRFSVSPAITRSKDWNRIGLAMFVLSASIAMIATGHASLHFPSMALPRSSGEIGNLASLAPVCVFGFLLCPYLDATFHMSRQRMFSGEAKLSFSIGFGLVFFAMIIFSLLYADTVTKWFADQVWTGVESWPFQFISFHWAMQLAFTIAVHWNGGDALGERKSLPSWTMPLLTYAAGALAAVLAFRHFLVFGLSMGEIIYRCFIGFYGLVFPAYVWLCMIPGRGRIAPSRTQCVVLAAAVIVALPMFWMGFIEREMPWVLPGLSVVLLARLFVPGIALARPNEGL